MRIHNVHSRELPAPAERVWELVAALSDREREILLEVARGSSNAEIAATLHLAEPTVKTYLGRLRSKLDVRDRVQLVIFAYDTGLVAPRR